MLPVVLVLVGVTALFVPYHYKASGTPQRLANALAEIPRALTDIAAVRHPYTACLIVLVILIGAFAPLAPAIVSVVLSRFAADPAHDPHRGTFAISALILFAAAVICMLLMEISQMVFGFGASRSGRRTPWMLLIILLPALTSLACAIAVVHRGWALAVIRACA